MTTTRSRVLTRPIHHFLDALRSWPQRWCVLPLTLLTVLTVFPLLSTGFTTNDDMQGALYVTGWLDLAVVQGRVGFILGYLIGQLPMLVDNPVYFTLIKFGMPLVLLGVLFVVVGRASRTFACSVLLATFFLAFYQNNWDHNAMTSYPVVFSFIALAFVLSLASYARYLKTGGAYGALAALLYFVSMSWEVFVPFFAVFVGAAVLHEVELGGLRPFRAKALSIAKHLWPIAATLALYLSLYAIWGLAHPSGYQGVIASNGGPIATARTIGTLSISAIPGFEFAYHHFFPQAPSLIVSHGLPSYSLGTLFAEMRVEWLVKAVLAAWLVWLALRDRTIALVPSARLRFGLLIAFVCMFLPNVALGFTEKYRQWVAAGTTSYVYTYYSFIAVVLFAALLTAWMVKRSAAMPRLRVALIAGVVVLTGALSIATDFHNYSVTTDQQLSQVKWGVVDRFTTTREFKSIPQDSVIYAPSLFSIRGIAWIFDPYWTDYLRQKTGKRVTVVASSSELLATAGSTGKFYYLGYFQEPYTANQYLVFSRITNVALLQATGGVREPAATILSYSKNKVATLVGFMANKDTGTYGVWIDGQRVEQTMPGAFTATLDWGGQATDLPTRHITSDADMDVSDFVVSYYGVEPDLSSYAWLGEGFYGWESAPGHSSWSWSSGNASLELVNAGRVAVPAVLSFKMYSPLPRKVRISGGTVEETMTLGRPGPWDEASVRVLMRPGVTSIRLTTDKPAAVVSGSGDSRKLAFAVSDLSVAPVSQQ